MIHHLSYPKGKSVNDGISPEHSSVQYANIDQAIKRIKQSGVGSYLAKTDIKSAVRILPINPQDYHLLVMKWNGQYYYHKCMPMVVLVHAKRLRLLVQLLNGSHRINSV